MDIAIREIKESDYAAVLALWNGLGNHFVTEENIGPYYEKEKLDDNRRTFVAVLDGKAVGFITVMQFLSVGPPMVHMNINGLAVAPELRGKGIGSGLVEHVERYAARRGVSFLGLNTGFKRKDAHRFYERHGFRTDSYCYTKKLSDYPTTVTKKKLET